MGCGSTVAAHPPTNDDRHFSVPGGASGLVGHDRWELFQVVEGQLDGVGDQAADAEAVVGEVGGGEGLVLG